MSTIEECLSELKHRREVIEHRDARIAECEGQLACMALANGLQVACLEARVNTRLPSAMERLVYVRRLMTELSDELAMVELDMKTAEPLFQVYRWEPSADSNG